jgi:hypothetical protein
MLRGVSFLPTLSGMDYPRENTPTSSDPEFMAREMAASIDADRALNKAFGRVGGMTRPWVKPIQRRTKPVPTNNVIQLWEGGVTTALEVKREIYELLASGYTLVEIIDSKRAEHPENLNWWPSLMEVLAWAEFDQSFAKMLDAWNHAHQLEIAEHITYNVLNPEESNLSDKFLKIQADFAAKVLPRLVNKGMADRVEVNQTNLNLNQASQKMSDDAIKARLAELSQNPKVLKLIHNHHDLAIDAVRAKQAAEPAVAHDPTPMAPGVKPIEGLDIPDIEGEKV